MGAKVREIKKEPTKRKGGKRKKKTRKNSGSANDSGGGEGLNSSDDAGKTLADAGAEQQDAVRSRQVQGYGSGSGVGA